MLCAEFELRSQARTADDTHTYIFEQGWNCASCRHRHSGAASGFVCAGCPCPRHAPTVPEFEQMRTVEFVSTIDFVDAREIHTSRPVDEPEEGPVH